MVNSKVRGFCRCDWNLSVRVEDICGERTLEPKDKVQIDVGPMDVSCTRLEILISDYKFPETRSINITNIPLQGW